MLTLYSRTISAEILYEQASRFRKTFKQCVVNTYNQVVERQENDDGTYNELRSSTKGFGYIVQHNHEKIILTTAHMCKGISHIVSEEQSYPATIIRADFNKNIAILRVNSAEFNEKANPLDISSLPDGCLAFYDLDPGPTQETIKIFLTSALSLEEGASAGGPAEPNQAAKHPLSNKV